MRIAEDELGLSPPTDLRVRTGDARGHLRDVPADSADLVVGDAFGGRAVPYHLATREFAADVPACSRDDGIYAQNIIDQPPLRFLWADVATLARCSTTSPSSARRPLRRQRGAATRSSSPATRRSRSTICGPSSPPAAPTTRSAPTPSSTTLTAGADVLTDDYAPVDQLLT